MNLPQVNIKFNFPQLLFSFSQAKESYLEWGRGTGKSTVIAWRIKEMAKMMPRAKIGLVGSDYRQILTRTLPATIDGLELLGYKKDLHYFVGRRPPKEWKWDEAYQPPLDYENYMTFYNGFGIQFISLDKKDSGRGLNIDGAIGDEAGLMDGEKLSVNVLTSNRGNIDRFNHTPLHHSILFASSTPITQTGRWFINQEEAAKQSKGKIFYLTAKSEFNKYNLGEEWFKLQRRILTDVTYNAEIHCIRPNKAETSFYPSFNEDLHTYLASNDKYLFSLKYDLTRLQEQTSKADLDCNPNQPIDLACDWGAKINTLVCAQKTGNVYNILNALFVKSPDTLKQLAAKFCDYYESHSRKVVNFYYDHTAVYLDAVRTTTFAEEFAKGLEARGWKVIMIYCGKAPNHHAKYNFWSIAFKEDDKRLPAFRLNRDNCKFLTISIQQAGVVEGRNGFEKDKRPERRSNAIDEETTHFSDAFDTLCFFKFKDSLTDFGFIV